ncbi:MAG: ATP-binding cassette domain-containing protein [Clostridia bacterium]|nr:ATP-binding cassette domain-containing protein [Clostridia bacterium]
MNEKTKKYFIKDSELTSIEQDKLSSKDIVKNISLVIDNTKPPYSIALTGKTGIGKSSIINLITEKYNNQEDYNVQKINVWRDEEISLKNIFEKQSDDQTIINEIEENVEQVENNQETKTSEIKKRKSFKKHI